jgi:hypothetical protein
MPRLAKLAPLVFRITTGQLLANVHISPVPEAVEVVSQMRWSLIRREEFYK